MYLFLFFNLYLFIIFPQKNLKCLIFLNNVCVNHDIIVVRSYIKHFSNLIRKTMNLREYIYVAYTALNVYYSIVRFKSFYSFCIFSNQIKE